MTPRSFLLAVPPAVLTVVLLLAPSPLYRADADPASRIEAASPQSTVPLGSLKSAINRQVRAARQVSKTLGVHVVEVASGRDIYSFRADEPHVVASNTKLATTAAALDRLGPGFFFETPVMLRGETREGVLYGDLGVVGGGDPMISGRHHLGDPYAVFRGWAAELRARGVERIAGEIVLATGLFDRVHVHPDWPTNQLDRWYEAPVAALSFNDNCVLVEVQPNGRVSLRPELPIFRVGGEVRVTPRPGQQSVRIGRRTDADDRRTLWTFNVFGSIYRNAQPVDRWVTVPDPVEYFGVALREALAEEGIEVQGRVLEASRLEGPGWRPLLVHRSDLLSALEVINKRSQNFYSESVLKLLGARLCDDGSWAGGVRAVSDFLESIDLDDGSQKSWNLADGSGMSRQNRFAPRHLTRLLRHMFTHHWGSEFVRTLPYSGEAGLSWRERLEEAPYRGNVLAKTGTLNGVSTLSGFAKGRSGTLYAFSILCNRTTANWRAKAAQDRILRALIDEG